jgi:hypothetical protein
MSIKKVLFLDDQNIDSTVSRLKSNLHLKGYDLCESIIHLSTNEFRKRDPVNKSKLILDFDKIKKVIGDKHMNEPYNLVACDYIFGPDILDGYKVLKWIKNVATSSKLRMRRAKFVLYSSEIDKLIEKTNSVEEIKKLIQLNLDGFYSRTSLETEIANILIKEDTQFDFTQSLISELEKYPDMKFQSVYPKFSGKSLKYIADEIDRDSTHGIKYQENLIELTIAHLIDLNKIEKK